MGLSGDSAGFIVQTPSNMKQLNVSLRYSPVIDEYLSKPGSESKELRTFVIVAHSHVVSDHVGHRTCYNVWFVGIYVHADAHGFCGARGSVNGHPGFATHKIFSTEND